MTMRKGDWSGGFTHGEQNTFPYKVESSEPRDMHEAREQSVVDAEKENL